MTFNLVMYSIAITVALAATGWILYKIVVDSDKDTED